MVFVYGFLMLDVVGFFSIQSQELRSSWVGIYVGALGMFVGFSLMGMREVVDRVRGLVVLVGGEGVDEVMVFGRGLGWFD